MNDDPMNIYGLQDPMILWQLPPIRLVTRRKLYGPLPHTGVDLRDNRIIHLQPEGIQISTEADFAQGLSIVPGIEIPEARRYEIYERLHEAQQMQPGYHWSEQNCEHFARWLVGETRESPTLKAAIVLSAIAAVAYIASRK